jgi:ankyrin repeat protein
LWQDIEGKTPLHHAIENGQQSIIALLLEQVSILIKKFGP